MHSRFFEISMSNRRRKSSVLTSKLPAGIEMEKEKWKGEKVKGGDRIGKRENLKKMENHMTFPTDVLITIP